MVEVAIHIQAFLLNHFFLLGVGVGDGFFWEDALPPIFDEVVAFVVGTETCLVVETVPVIFFVGVGVGVDFLADDGLGDGELRIS